MPIVRIATVIIIGIVVLAGGIVMITDPSSLPFHDYVRDVAVAVGLLSIAHGIDKNSIP